MVTIRKLFIACMAQNGKSTAFVFVNENLSKAGHSSIKAEGQTDIKELVIIDNASMNITPIHLSTKASVSLSIEENNDPKNRLETA